MSKKTFKPNPQKKQPTAKEVDQFLDHGPGHDTKKQKTSNLQMKVSSNEEKRTRVNFEIPLSTHARFKAACALNNTKMINELQNFVERRTAELEKTAKVSA